MKSLTMAAFMMTFAAGPALADPVRVDLNGHLYAVTPSVSGKFEIGDLVTASFTFDSSDLGENWYPGGNLDPAFRYYVIISRPLVTV